MMRYYKRILEKTTGTGIIMKQDIIVMLFPLLARRGDYVDTFRNTVREIVENCRENRLRLEQISSIIILGIKYHLLDSAFIQSDLISTVYSDELSTIRQSMYNACTVIQNSRVQTNRYSLMTGVIRHDSHRSVNPESMAKYLVCRLHSHLKAITHTEFLDAIVDEGCNPSKYPNFTSMSAYTNDISRFVSKCADPPYFIKVLKVLVSMKNYHIVAAIIAGLGDIPKKHTLYIKNMSMIVMSPTYDVFISRIGGKAKSTNSIPFLGTIITDIKHAIEDLSIDYNVPSRISKSQWNILEYIHRLVRLFRVTINIGDCTIVDYSIDLYFNRVLEDLYIYLRKIYEWTVSDVCTFVRNVLITDTILYDIDSIVSKIEQLHIDGKTLERLTVDELVTICGLTYKVAKRIVSRREVYNEDNDSIYTDSVHDTCTLLHNKGLDRYCKVFAYHQILPSMIQHLTDEDFNEMEVQSEDIELIRSIAQ